jgi:hypothetical protein
VEYGDTMIRMIAMYVILFILFDIFIMVYGVYLKRKNAKVEAAKRQLAE